MAIDASTHPPTFLHTLVAGGASHSFGIAVARMAGVPEEVTGKAEQLLQHLEQANSVVVVPKTEKSETEEGPYSAASLAGKGTTSQNIIEKIRSISLDTCTPLEALSLLADLQESIRK